MVNRPAPGKAAGATTQIVQAAHDLEMGAVIHKDDVKLAECSGNVPAGATAHPEDVLERGVLTPIYAREPVIETRLAPKGAGGGLAAMIPVGMRAVAVRVNEVVGVAGFVIAGMKVDVLISGTSPNSDQRLGTQTRTMLQNIEVLSAGQDFKKDAEGKPQPVQVVNLLVTPDQAELLRLAANSLKIQLVLRNPLDTQVTKIPATAMSNLFASQAPTTHARAPRGPAKHAEKPYSIVVMNGNKTTDEKFASPEGQH